MVFQAYDFSCYNDSDHHVNSYKTSATRATTLTTTTTADITITSTLTTTTTTGITTPATTTTTASTSRPITTTPQPSTSRAIASTFPQPIVSTAMGTVPTTATQTTSTFSQPIVSTGMTKTATTTATQITCPKCALNKQGQSSCCPRGGSWFKKCGHVGDPNFAHTWLDGIEACKPTLTGD